MNPFETKRFSPFATAVVALMAWPLIAVGQGTVKVTATADTPSPQWTGWGQPTEIGVHATAVAPVPDTGSTLQGPTWSWSVIKVEYSNDNVSWTEGGSYFTQFQNGNSADDTLKAWFYQGAYWRITCQATVGYSETPGTKTWTGSGTCQAKPNCAELVSLTVTGATQNNVSQVNDYPNWAAVLQYLGTVTITATVAPNDPNAANLIQWTGGSAVTGDNTQRTVDKGTSAKTTVTATVGAAPTQGVNIWILWVTITVQVAGNTPANAVQFGASYDGTEILGGRSYGGGTIAVGKVVPVGQITPAGAGAVATAGWNFRRDRWFTTFKDGVVAGPFNDANWVDDTSGAGFQRLTPDANDKIYDRDAPNVAAFGATTDTQVYANFREYVQWNPTPAQFGTPPAPGTPTTSDYALWSWTGRWHAASTPQITVMTAATGNITLPNMPAP